MRTAKFKAVEMDRVLELADTPTSITFNLSPDSATEFIPHDEAVKDLVNIVKSTDDLQVMTTVTLIDGVRSIQSVEIYHKSGKMLIKYDRDITPEEVIIEFVVESYLSKKEVPGILPIDAIGMTACRVGSRLMFDPNEFLVWSNKFTTVPSVDVSFSPKGRVKILDNNGVAIIILKQKE